MQGTNPWQDYIDYLLRVKLDWEEDAPCKSVGPQVMYPASESKQLKVAQRICDGCPAIAECLTIALATEETFGVWGGATERQRIDMQKKLNKTSDAYEKAKSITNVVIGFLKGQTSESKAALA